MITIEEILERHLLERKIFNDVVSFLDRPEALVITGPRQSGKTSLLFLIAKYILKKRKGNIFYYDLEFPDDLELLKNLSFPSTLPVNSFLFIDEIQYHPNPDKLIKFTVDHLKGKVKLIVSGSSSLKLRSKFKEALVGRKIEFVLFSLSFEEFLLFKGRKDILGFIKRAGPDVILPLLEEYLIFGGYPGIVLEEDINKKKKLLGEIFSAYIYRDIIPLFNLKQPEKFTDTMRMIAGRMGGMLNILSISNDIRISRETAVRYIKALELTYLIYPLPAFSTNPRKEITKMSKVYFIDTGLRNWAVGNMDVMKQRVDMGTLVENFVLLEFLKSSLYGLPIGYWRTKMGAEVDFVIDRRTPAEVKFTNLKKLEVPRGVKNFVNKYHPKKGYILTKGIKGQVSDNGCDIHFLPCWMASRIEV